MKKERCQLVALAGFVACALALSSCHDSTKSGALTVDSLKYDYAKRGFNTRILEELEELDFARQYNSIFGSKYLYIKNADIKKHVIIDANGKEHDIAPDEIQVWHTGILVCVDTSKLTLAESETAAVRL